MSTLGPSFANDPAGTIARTTSPVANAPVTHRCHRDLEHVVHFLCMSLRCAQVHSVNCQNCRNYCPSRPSVTNWDGSYLDPVGMRCFVPLGARYDVSASGCCSHQQREPLRRIWTFALFPYESEFEPEGCPRHTPRVQRCKRSACPSISRLCAFSPLCCLRVARFQGDQVIMVRKDEVSQQRGGQGSLYVCFRKLKHELTRG